MPTTLLAALALSLAAPQDQGGDPPIPEDKEVVTLESGLRYSLLEPGDADAGTPKMGDVVLVHYTGWTTDGRVFDSSRRRGEPTQFALGMVVEGWNEGLQHCPIGGRIKLTIPPALAYGERGVPQAGIPSGATLVFDVELLEIPKRSLAAVAWPEAEDAVQTAESGLAWHVIEPGEGEPLGDTIAVAEYTVRNAAGGWVGGSTYSGNPGMPFNGPLVLAGQRLPFRFLSEAKAQLRPGARVQFRVPAAQAFGGRELPNLPKGTDSLWQLEVVRTIDAAAPEFQMPEESELTTTESGLQYKILREGDGAKPVETSTVVAHYTGWLTSGMKFDSSWDRGAPIDFPLRGVVRGWTEGLQLVREGGRILLVIPSELGYGQRRAGSIPPGSTLVFVVDLVASL